MASLAAGLAIGIVGDSCVRAYGKQDKIFVAMIMVGAFLRADASPLPPGTGGLQVLAPG